MRYSVIFILIIISNGLVKAQTITDKILKNDVTAITMMRDRLPIEKLYLQTDKPYYTSGDTLRFKSYLLNGDFLTPATKSGLLYVELDDQNNQLVKRIMVPVISGISWGDVALDEKTVPPGSYILRAYTNWIRNFGEDYIFKKSIYILNSAGNATLVKANFKPQKQADKTVIQTTLQFTNLDGRQLDLQDMQLRVTDGKKNISKNKITTGFDGNLKLNIDVPDKAGRHNLIINARQISNAESTELTIPVILNRPENIDLQFMPEGGQLIAGITSKIGFKAISEDGKGIAIGGRIYNSKEQQVTEFKSTHAGMGSFELNPQSAETYVAKVTLSDGTSKTFQMPAVNQMGTSLKITDQNKDSIQITLQASNALFNKAGTYYLIGQAKGVVCYAQPITFNNSTIDKIIAKNLFPTGIARFTLLNTDHQPLNERLVFIDHHDNLQISINTNKQNYAIRDSIALSITVKDNTGKPVQGNYLLAVTDDSQVKTDSLGSNIGNNLLFTSELKGTIEDPGYYFTGNDKAPALDNLLLTQGWVGYDWKSVFNTVPVLYELEQEYIVKGTVLNVFNNPIKKSKVILMTGRPLIFRDTVTDDNGRFAFKGFFPVDTALFKLQARNKHDKSYNIKIDMDELKPPVFASSFAMQLPWYVNSDTIQLKNTNTKITQLKAIENYEGDGRVLKEVKIKDKKIVKDSENLNGPGEADEVLDEEDMDKAGKMTLGEMLEKKIKGFKTFGIWEPCGFCKPKEMTYVLNNKRVHLVFDGMDIDYYYFGKTINDRLLYIKDYLDTFTAEDITGIEVIHTSKYTSRYYLDFSSRESDNNSANGTKRLDGVAPDGEAYIEITTRSKKGPFMRTVAGTYLYKTLPFTLPKQFYRPRYTIKNTTAALGTDLRSTIHWEPNVFTDKDGKAIVSFYSADKPATYSVIVEGTDLNGNFGYQRQQIKVSHADMQP